MANVVLLNDYNIEWTITDATDGSAITGATVTAQLYDSSGNTFGSSITLSEVVTSPVTGLYRGTLPDTSSPSKTAPSQYTLICTATTGGGVVATRKVPINTLPL